MRNILLELTHFRIGPSLGRKSNYSLRTTVVNRTCMIKRFSYVHLRRKFTLVSLSIPKYSVRVRSERENRRARMCLASRNCLELLSTLGARQILTNGADSRADFSPSNPLWSHILFAWQNDLAGHVTPAQGRSQESFTLHTYRETREILINFERLLKVNSCR